MEYYRVPVTGMEADQSGGGKQEFYIESREYPTEYSVEEM